MRASGVGGWAKGTRGCVHVQGLALLRGGAFRIVAASTAARFQPRSVQRGRQWVLVQYASHRSWHPLARRY
jgi:hypothetical protein